MGLDLRCNPIMDQADDLRSLNDARFCYVRRSGTRRVLELKCRVDGVHFDKNWAKSATVPVFGGNEASSRSHEEEDVPNSQTEDSATSFGPFRLFPKARLLEKNGDPVHIGGRALDVLIFLAE